MHWKNNKKAQWLGYTQPDGRKRAEIGGTGRAGHGGPVAIECIWIYLKLTGSHQAETLKRRIGPFTYAPACLLPKLRHHFA